ncbi:MAG TPA: MBG domain-containing protein, partial [Candidatus Saccharimonadales bacterium]|nr:MBG domain-containing protein [Candidatus Saccharimonadales bacterium]
KLGNYTVTSSNGTLTVNPAPLSVTAASTTRIYGDPNPTFTGTITGIKNGDNITATYSSTATAASPIGTYPIVPALADPAGRLGNYTVSTNNGTLTVSPALLTVTAANATRAFGAPNPVFTGTLVGVKNSDNITATFASAATATSPVGTYPIVPALADPTGKLTNYTVVSNNGILTVTGALLTVTVDSASRLYGDANPVFTGTIAGIQNGDNITATYASIADPTSPVGTYAIVPTLVDPAGKLSNYSVVVNNGILTVTPAPLSVTADNASRLYGDPNPAFTGTIVGLKNNDNITAAYASAGPASPIGTYPITATLVDPTAKAGNYTVTFVNATLTVNPAPLSVSAANASRFYGDPNPAFTGTITGIKNGDNITASYSTTATAASAPGTYPIVPALVDPTGKLSNYTVTAVNNGILTVNPAPLTVTAANASRLYGDPNPALTGTITGIRNGDAITASYSTVATPASSAGSYAIVATLSDPTGKLANYTVVSNNGILTVNPAPLTVTGTNATRLYGDANPAFTGTVSGLKNGDIITATFASAADPTSPVGSYAIIATLADPGAKLGNYSVISNNGILTVTPAPLAATANSASRLYGDPNPAFSGTITGLKNGDNITATFVSAATAASPVGTYPIAPSFIDPAGRLGNYA